MSTADTRRLCTEQLPAEWQDEGPVFAEPWQAQAFALTVSLIESGQVSWPQWAETLGDEIAHAREHGMLDDGSDYYQLWLRALERLVQSSGLASSQELNELEAAWRHAFDTTPHGEPVSIS